MALGNTQTRTCRNSLYNINARIVKLDDCLNTFDYVVSNLSVWADETTVGSQMKENLEKLTKAVYSTIESSKTISNNIKEFLDLQEQYNNG